jgi:hypothetical protein
MISKLTRLYKRTYTLRQICNIAVYIIHSACTIHLLNLPDKSARRDIAHGVKHLEEIAEDWPCARRTLSILSVLARKWQIELPEEAAVVLMRTDSKYGTYNISAVPSPKTESCYSAANSPRNTSRITSQSQQPPYFPLGQSPDNFTSSPVSIGPQSNELTKAIGQSMAPQNGNISSGTLPTTVDGCVGVSHGSSIQIDSQYQQGQYSVPASGQCELGLQSSSGTPSATFIRQVSPSARLGGTEALVDSQEWWLKDQASLAIGFDNWGSLDFSEYITGATDGIPSSIQGVEGGYYVPVNMIASMTGNGFRNDWYSEGS